MQADKSICLKGNLQNGPIIYRPYPVNEFTSGKWLISINSILFESAIELSTTCAVTCNFSTSQKRTKRGEITGYEMPLTVFHLKTTTSARRSIFRFTPVYYPMNSVSDELQISLLDIFADNDVPLKLNCDLVVQILFQRVN